MVVFQKKEVVRIHSQKGDFPFEIRDVMYLLGLPVGKPMGSRGVYTNCPFCGDKRGKMGVNYEQDVFNCNYCGAHGGMLNLYADIYGVDCKTAFKQIVDALGKGVAAPAYTAAKAVPMPPPVAQSPPASARDVHETLSLLLEMLPLYAHHEKNLHARGLDGKQIKHLGYKSTPPPSLCRSLTEALIEMGCTVAGVPGFYKGDDGQWTVKFKKRTSGMLIPVKGMDGLVRGAQIRLDVPFEDGNKYIWFSSSSASMGATSGSPAHFVGNPYSRAVYVTEGVIKADVANLFMHRTFISIPGANNVGELDGLFAILAKNGTRLIVEAHDMDKYGNAAVNKGACRISAIAHDNGMECKRLTWNPNHKGIDDWQLHLRKRKEEADRVNSLPFKQRYLEGLCEISSYDEEIARWRRMPEGRPQVHDFLGFTAGEFVSCQRPGVMEALLNGQRKEQDFRLYQLELSETGEVIPFAFADTSVMREKGKFDYPPAAKYRMVYDSSIYCPVDAGVYQILARIRAKYSDELPDDLYGRQVAVSDIIELYTCDERRYYYCNKGNFEAVRFSPMLAMPMKSSR